MEEQYVQLVNNKCKKISRQLKEHYNIRQCSNIEIHAGIAGTEASLRRLATDGHSVSAPGLRATLLFTVETRMDVRA